MEAIYRLNAKELGSEFINSVRDAYMDRNIEITVREQDETEYLLSSSANRKHLEKAVENVERGENLISFDTIEQARQSAEEWAAR
jgi:antitoxin YefM